MPKKPTNYEKVEVKENNMPKLPAGAYIIGIQSARCLGDDGYLELKFDIIEGDYKDFYQQKYDYESETSTYEVKWKGSKRVYLPGDEEWQIEKWKKFILAFEESNDGFHFVWDEDDTKFAKQFKGLMVGLMLRDEEYSFEKNGETITGFSARPYYFLSTSRVASAKVPEPLTLAAKANKKASDSPVPFVPTNTKTDLNKVLDDDGDDLPW